MMLEGSRAFDIVWGTTFGVTCFALGFRAVWLWLVIRKSGRPSMFGAAIDPGRGLHLAWGIFTLAMGGTNFGCRYIDHRYLSGVHEVFFTVTLLAIGIVAPLLVRDRLAERAAA